MEEGIPKEGLGVRAAGDVAAGSFEGGDKKRLRGGLDRVRGGR
jgi:hypothetical protein